MKLSPLCLPLTAALSLTAMLSNARAEEPKPAAKYAIIKVDDLKLRTPKWDAFLAAAKAEGVKVSIGIICNSLETPNPENEAWLKELSASGEVEFWNHGWDHKSWEADGKKLSEFSGSGYEHQKENLVKAQEASERVFGKPFNVLGTPFNGMDADTAKVLAEIPEITLVFNYPNVKELGGKTPLPMVIRGEADGTGKPNSVKFIPDYQLHWKDATFSAIQFHPNSFGETGVQEFTNIIKFLKIEGWQFILPSEYAAKVGATAVK